MTYNRFLFLLLTCSLSFAQTDLFVSNGSYIYVDGNGFTDSPDVAPLFVTNAVELNANSHLYLRNQAQLLQGNDIGNSGLGELSVYQTGNVNQWSYNYWCSPIGAPSVGNGNVAARVNLLNDATDIINSTPALFTPGFDGIANPLTISDRWLYTYQAGNSYNDWVYVGSTGTITPGLGFTMKGNGTGPTGSQLYDFRGKPNNGTITNTVADGQFTLVGNPYPSAIDAVAFIHDTDNVNAIEPTLFYWEQSGTVTSHVLQDYIGGYATYTIDALGNNETFNFALFFTYDEQDNSTPVFTPTPPFPPQQAEGIKIAGRYIPIGQGFMVEGLAGGSVNVVTVRNAHRTFVKEDGSNSVFFRSAASNTDESTNNTLNSGGIQYQENGLSIVPADYKRFRINVDFTVGESQYTRQLVLNFHDTATFGEDRGLELKLPRNYDSDAYFIQNEKNMSCVAYPFNETLRIPLVIDIEEQQPLRFRIFDVQNFEESQAIYIYDLVTNNYINLRDNDYDLNIIPGHYTNRFELVFATDSVLSTDDLELNMLRIVQNNDLQELQIINPNGLDIASVSLIDISGRTVISTSVNSIKNQLSISTQHLTDGVYIASVKTKTDAVKTQKVIVKN